MKGIKRVQLINKQTQHTDVDINYMRNGKIKYVKKDEMIVQCRYSHDQVSTIRILHTWMKTAAAEIQIRYVRNTNRVDITINNSYDLHMLDINTDNLQTKIHPDNFYLYVLKCLHLPEKTTYVVVHMPYLGERYKREYVVKYSRDDTKEIYTLQSTVINIMSREEFIFQKIEYGAFTNIIYENIPNIFTKEFTYIMGVIDQIKVTTPDDKYRISYTYNKDGTIKNIRNKISGNIGYHYDDDGKLLIEKLNRKICAKYEYNGNLPCIKYDTVNDITYDMKYSFYRMAH